jgi:hypothetical protein
VSDQTFASAEQQEPLLIVNHGTASDIAQAAEAFARFYQQQFYTNIHGAFVKSRRMVYIAAAIVAAILMVSGLIPIFLNSNSIFAYLLLIMSAMLAVAIIFCLVKIRQAPEYCQQHLPEYFAAQIASAKRPDKVVRESRFYPKHVEIISGEPATPKSKARPYQQIPRVYETEEIYFLEGLTWIPKQLLSQAEQKQLSEIISKEFAGKHQRV